MPYTVCKYADQQQLWNDFIAQAKNTSFLFHRDFIAYHGSRFEDYSLMVFEGNSLRAVLPANLTAEGLFSHQGLSYGGLVIDRAATMPQVVAMMREILAFLCEKNIQKCHLKLIPTIYHRYPANEIDWILFRLQAVLYRRDFATVVDNSVAELPWQQRRVRAAKKAAQKQAIIRSGYEELAPFWEQVLIPNLSIRHGLSPVHTLDEIQHLARLFPRQIIQHNIYLTASEPAAGCTIFLNDRVAHAQYIANNPSQMNSGCLDLLFEKLIRETYRYCRYFSFGISNENQGLLINKGLTEWKEGFGGRTITHDFYEIATANYPLLDNCFV
ncbi:hypothetical protein [Rhodoflexus sp.]